LAAIILDLGRALTDQTIDVFERLVGTMFSKAETRQNILEQIGLGSSTLCLPKRGSIKEGILQLETSYPSPASSRTRRPGAPRRDNGSRRIFALR
jgi:hypothetical protein